MAFRPVFFVKHGRTLTARLSGTHKHTSNLFPLRSFSHSPLLASAEKPFPVDSLVADVIGINQQLEADPPKRKGKKNVQNDNIVGSVELPPGDKWPEYFPWSVETKARLTLMDPKLAKKLAEIYVPEGARDQVIVEAFPGPGVLTRALLELPRERIKKLIVLEDYQPYSKFIKPLETLDSRVTLIPLSGYSWDAYNQISAMGLFDELKTASWSQAHPQLKFISHMPTRVHGEQFVSQLFRSIPERQWLFKYGRVPLHLLMTSSLWDRISAPPNGSVRCKLSVIAEAAATFGFTLPLKDLALKAEQFHPRTSRQTDVLSLVPISIWPSVDQPIERGTIDEWDYLLRHLFVQRATPLKKSLPQLAPGASTLLKKVTDPTLSPDRRLDPKTPPRSLNAKQWKILADVFIDWPFKPESLSIDSFHLSSTKADSKKVI